MEFSFYAFAPIIIGLLIGLFIISFVHQANVAAVNKIREPLSNINVGDSLANVIDKVGKPNSTQVIDENAKLVTWSCSNAYGKIFYLITLKFVNDSYTEVITETANV